MIWPTEWRHAFSSPLLVTCSVYLFPSNLNSSFLPSLCFHLPTIPTFTLSMDLWTPSKLECRFNFACSLLWIASESCLNLQLPSHAGCPLPTANTQWRTAVFVFCVLCRTTDAIQWSCWTQLFLNGWFIKFRWAALPVHNTSVTPSEVDYKQMWATHQNLFIYQTHPLKSTWYCSPKWNLLVCSCAASVRLWFVYQNYHSNKAATKACCPQDLVPCPSRPFEE